MNAFHVNNSGACKHVDDVEQRDEWNALISVPSFGIFMCIFRGHKGHPIEKLSVWKQRDGVAG